MTGPDRTSIRFAALLVLLLAAPRVWESCLSISSSASDRAEYYHDKERPHESDIHAMAKWQDRKAQVEGCAEVIVEKHRNGPTGSVELGFQFNLIQFSEQYGAP